MKKIKKKEYKERPKRLQGTAKLNSNTVKQAEVARTSKSKTLYFSTNLYYKQQQEGERFAKEIFSLWPKTITVWIGLHSG